MVTNALPFYLSDEQSLCGSTSEAAASRASAIPSSRLSGPPG
jgi:hypothetical protein